MMTINLRIFKNWKLLNCCLLLCGYGPIELSSSRKKTYLQNQCSEVFNINRYAINFSVIPDFETLRMDNRGIYKVCIYVHPYVNN